VIFLEVTRWLLDYCAFEMLLNTFTSRLTVIHCSYSKQHTTDTRVLTSPSISSCRLLSSHPTTLWFIGQLPVNSRVFQVLLTSSSDFTGSKRPRLSHPNPEADDDLFLIHGGESSITRPPRVLVTPPSYKPQHVRQLEGAFDGNDPPPPPPPPQPSSSSSSCSGDSWKNKRKVCAMSNIK
jgi:hypothetical protein